MTLSEWQARIGTWSVATFGDADHLESCVRHAHRELDEVLAASPSSRGEEVADVLILLLTIAHRNGIDLEHELHKKHTLNKSRCWGKPDAEGVIEHVREDVDHG